MPRIVVAPPGAVHFSCELSVRISDVNFGGHLGHDSLIRLVHEARARFFDSLGYSELNVEGAGIILADLAVVYRSEAHFRDRLRFDLAAEEFWERGCEIAAGVYAVEDQREIAFVRTGLRFFDYQAGRSVAVPPGFRRRFP